MITNVAQPHNICETRKTSEIFRKFMLLDHRKQIITRAVLIAIFLESSEILEF